MQSSTPTRPVSGTFFQAVQTFRPHPRIRPVSAPTPDTYPQHTVTLDTGRCSVPSDPTILNRPESLHLYTSRRQYEVATSCTLGSLAHLDTDVPRSPHSPGSMLPTSSPLSPRSLLARAKQLLTPPSLKSPKTPDTPRAGKLAEAFCRTKTMVKSLRRGSKEVVIEQDSRGSLRSGVYLKDEVLRLSKISDEPPQIAPLRPVSKFLPGLTIFVPENEIAGEFVIEHGKIEYNDIFGDFSEIGFYDSPVIAPLCSPLSTINSTSQETGTTAETTLYTAGETSFHYTSAAKHDDDIFTTSRETSHTQRPMTSFIAKLQDAMNPDRGYKTPSSVCPEEGSVPYTPSPSPRLRHTALNPARGEQSGSLRVQYSNAEITPPVLTACIPKMWQVNENEREDARNLRVAPSLEKGLHADTLEVFEENATADVVDIRRSEALVQPASQDFEGTGHVESDRTLMPPPLVIKHRPERVPSVTGPEYEGSTMPIEILRTIVFSAAYGNAKCTELASRLYEALVESDSSITDCQWRKERSLQQAHLLAELKILVQYGHLRDEVFSVIRGQIFPTTTTEVMSNVAFTNYIHRAVSEHLLAKDRAEGILGLAVDEEDQGFKQTSPEDEVFFQRGPFNEETFVYDVASSDECYEWLGSLPSTAATFEHWDQLPPAPEAEPRWSWWRSPFASKMAHLFRIGYRKPVV